MILMGVLKLEPEVMSGGDSQHYLVHGSAVLTSGGPT